MVRNLFVAMFGAVGAVALAVVLSPIAPVGEARLAELSTGVSFDTLVLPSGLVAMIVVVLVLGIWPALRAARTWRSVTIRSGRGPRPSPRSWPRSAPRPVR